MLKSDKSIFDFNEKKPTCTLHCKYTMMNFDGQA